MRFPKPALIAAGVLAFALAVFLLVPPTTPIGGMKVNPGARPGGLPPVETQVRPAARPIEPSAVVEPSPAAEEPAISVAQAPEPEEETTPARPVVDADPDRAYQEGYRWAASNEVQDPRECRQLPDGPAATGCRAYAREVQAWAEEDGQAL